MVDFSEITSSPLFIVGAAFGLIGLLQMAAGFIVLFRRQPVGFLVRILIGMAVTAAGVAAAAVAVGIRGYADRDLAPANRIVARADAGVGSRPTEVHASWRRCVVPISSSST